VSTFILGRFFILALIATHINYKAIVKGIAGKSNKKKRSSIMAKNKERDFSICEIFREWFAENSHRFNQKCRIRYYKNREYNHIHIVFENVAKEIYCWVNENLTLEIAARYEGEIICFIIDLECTVRRGKNRKYYCGFCEPPKYYNTPKELVVEHTFENFLEWANEKFNTDHVLKLEYIGGYWCSGKILTKKELKKNPIKKKDKTGDNAVLIVPMINGDGAPVLYGNPLTKAQQRALRKQERK